MSAKVIAVLVGLLVAAGVVVVVAGSKDDNTPASTPAPVVTKSPSKAPSPAVSSAAVTVKYTASGFSPKEVHVKAGQSVLFENEGVKMQVASDPHPTHTKNPELNGDLVAAGKGDLLTFTKVGTWGYHDHLNPSHTGTIIVE